MDLQPLKNFIARHGLETDPAHSVLDVMAQLGDVSRALLKDTSYGRNAVDTESELVRRKIGDLMFAVAYLSTLYEVDPEAAMWQSVQKFEEQLEAGHLKVQQLKEEH